MRKKLKAILAVIVGAFAFMTIGVTTVNATEYTATTVAGTVEVTNSNTEKKWDFTTITASTKFTTGDTVNGIVVEGDIEKVQCKSGYLDIISSDTAASHDGAGTVYIPVPDGSAGTLNVKWNSSNPTRGLQLYNATANTYSYTNSSKSVVAISFTSNNITKYAESGSYLKLVGWDTSKTETENKISYFDVVLTTGTFESVAANVSVDIKDADGNTLKTEIVKEGEKISYTPIVFGQNFDGYYTDSLFENKFDYENVAITSSITTLYAKFSTDDAYSVANQYALDSTIMNYAMSKVGSNNTFGTDTNVPDTIYTVFGSCKAQTTSGYNCIGTVGAVKNNANAIKIEVPSDGMLSVYMTVAGTSARNAKLLNSDSEETSVTTGNAAWTDTEASNYELRTLEYKVSSGTYYLGGSNGMRIVTCEFVPYSVTALQQEATSDDYTYVRFITKITGVADVTTSDATKLVFTMTYADNTTKEVDYTSHMYIADAIKNNSEDYTATVNDSSYTFANHTCEYYVVCVVRLTTAKFNGCKIHATLTYGGNTYTSTDGTIGNAQ